MNKTESQGCNFFLLRYVPDAVKNEFVNIGLVVTPPGGPPELRFTRNWSRVLGLNPQADLEFLKEFREEALRDPETVFKKLQDSFSGALQASELKPCITESAAREADTLARLYLQSPPRSRIGERTARHSMLRQMKQEFSSAGVWQAMEKKIPVARYTGTRDPLRIDCGYGTTAAIKLFHATPLKAGVNAAKALAFSYPALARGIESSEGLHPQLTAVIEDGLDRSDDAVGFGLEILRENSIQVAELATLPGLAATAAREIAISNQ